MLRSVVEDLLGQLGRAQTSAELCAALGKADLQYSFLTPAELDAALETAAGPFVRLADGQWTLARLVARSHILSSLEGDVVGGAQTLHVHDDHRDFVFFDLEATGKDVTQAEIIQIAACRVTPSVEVIDDFGERLLRPRGAIPKEVTDLTGITDDDVATAPPASLVLAEFVAFARGAWLVAHNGAVYDGPLLQRALIEYGLVSTDKEPSHEQGSSPLRNDASGDGTGTHTTGAGGSTVGGGAGTSIMEMIIDSLEASCVVLPLLVGRKLVDLGAHYALESGDAHRAGNDVALMTAVVRCLRDDVARWPAPLRAALPILLSSQPGLCALLGLKARGGRADPAAGVDFEVVLDQIVASVTAGGTSVPQSRAESVAHAADAFASDGPLHRAASEAQRPFSPRPVQGEMAQFVEDTFAQGAVALCEAGTGTGKTKAYLVPAIRRAIDGEKVVVATHTKALQDQMARELAELATVRGIGGRMWRYAILKGRSNYLCLYNLAAALREVGPRAPRERRVALAALLVWAATAKTGDDSELSLEVLLRRDDMGAVHTALRGAKCDEECSGSRCHFYGPCFFFKARGLAAEADIVAASHALLLTKPDLLGEDDEGSKHVVIDEAHTLEDAATDAWTVDVSGYEIAAVLDRVNRTEGRRSAGWRIRTAEAFGLSASGADSSTLAEYVQEAHSALDGASRACALYLDQHDHRRGEEAHYGHRLLYASVARRRPWLVMAAEMQVLVRALLAVSTAVQTYTTILETKPLVNNRYSAAGLLFEGSCLAHQAQELAHKLASMLKLSDEHNLVYLLEAPALAADERGKEKSSLSQPTWRFKALPVDVTSRLREALVARARSLVLTSATLTIEGSFDFPVRRLGLSLAADRLRMAVFASPFDYAHNALLLLPSHLPAPRTSTMGEYLERLSAELVRYARVFGGHALVLLTARAHLKAIAARVRAPLTEARLTLYAQDGPGSSDNMVRAFRQDSAGILLGVRTFWEGVDIPGDDVRHVIIAKLPFSNAADPLLAARVQRLVDAGASNPFDDYLLPLCVMLFKQGFGRLIRTATDRGVVVVTDRRLASSFYRDVFLRSLPANLPVSENSDRAFYQEVAAFFGLDLPAADLADLPRTTTDEIIAACRLAPDDSREERAAKLTDSLTLFQQTAPPITAFRPEQLSIMLSSLEGDTLAILPTGAGKSLCFQLPALLGDTVTVIISPLVALMKDQVDTLRRDRNLHKVRAIVHSVSRAEQLEIMEDIAADRCRLLYLAPERVRDQGTVTALKAMGVARIVVDEAHCVSLWGPTFRPEFLSIRTFLQALGRPPVLALTATATRQVRDDIIAALDLDLGPVDGAYPARLHIGSFDRRNLFFGVKILSNRRAKDRELVRMIAGLAQATQGGAAIVYVARKREAERLARLIERQTQIAAQAYHAGLTPSLRESIQEAFSENGTEDLAVIVATKAFGMGIDKSDVRAVIHYDMPDSLESYYQEAGRAGRDGKDAYCVLLYTARDQDIQRYFIEQSAPPIDVVRAIYKSILAPARSAPTQKHRRSASAPKPPVSGAPGEGVSAATGAGAEDGGTFATGTEIYLDPETLAEDVGVSESTVRVILHHLAVQGIITRSEFDYATRARLKLLRPPQEILSFLHQRPADTPQLDALSSKEETLIARVIAYLDYLSVGEREFSPLSVGRALGVSPPDVEGALLHLCRLADGRGKFALYRSWERSMVVSLAPGAPSAAEFDRDLVSESRAAAYKRLAAMRHYATTEHCRRALILRYLGQSASGNCGACDACTSFVPWPWASQPAPVDLDAGIDVPWEVLCAVARSGGVYTFMQIRAALRGQEFSSHGYRLKARLLAADFFGRLQDVPQRRVDAARGALLGAGLLVEREREAGPVGATYNYVADQVTASGLAAYHERRLPDAVRAAAEASAGNRAGRAGSPGRRRSRSRPSKEEHETETEQGARGGGTSAQGGQEGGPTMQVKSA